MKCNEFSDSILDIHYQVATAEVVQAFHSHSKSCSDCQASLKGLQEVSLLFNTLPQVEPSMASIELILQKSKKTSVWSFIYSPMQSLAKIWESALQVAPVMVGLFVGVAALHIVTNKAPSAQPVISSNIEQGALNNRLLDDQFNLSQNYSNNTFQLPQAPGLQAPVVKTAFDDQALFNDDTVDVPFGGVNDQLKERFEQRKRQLLEADADAIMMRGRRLKAMGRVDLALADFETIYQFHPSYTYMSDVLMYRAQCYAIQGRLDQAVESLNELIKRFPAKKDMVLPMIEQLKVSQ